MDFSAWSPSHLLVAFLAFATIIGQAVAVLSRLKTTAERQEKQSEFFYNALDKRIDEVSKQISETRSELKTEIGDVRSELKTEISEVRSELSKLNQNHIDHLSHHER